MRECKSCLGPSDGEEYCETCEPKDGDDERHANGCICLDCSTK